jgi:hypothetical protein
MYPESASNGVHRDEILIVGVDDTDDSRNALARAAELARPAMRKPLYRLSGTGWSSQAILRNLFARYSGSQKQAIDF